MKNLKRLLCLLLCLITVTCCGCLESCLNCMIEDMYERQRKENIELKKIAETFVPEVTDYELFIEHKKNFASREEWESQGFFDANYSQCNYYNKEVDDGYILTFENGENVENEEFFEIISLEGEKVTFPATYFTKRNIFDKETTVGYDFFYEYIYRQILCFDGKLFVFDMRDNSAIGAYNIPPALYLIDFENEKLLYCGYAKELYDFWISSKSFRNGSWRGYVHSIHYMLFKIVKRENT